MENNWLKTPNVTGHRRILIDCLGVGSVALLAMKDRGCLYTENSACQAIYNVGWFSGCANALPTAKTTLSLALLHTGMTRTS